MDSEQETKPASEINSSIRKTRKVDIKWLGWGQSSHSDGVGSEKTSCLSELSHEGKEGAIPVHIKRLSVPGRAGRWGGDGVFDLCWSAVKVGGRLPVPM
jgi:hypothetical protein